MNIRFLLLFPMAIILISCESEGTFFSNREKTTASIGSKREDRFFSYNFDDDDSEYNNLSDTYYWYDHFVSRIQGHWTQLLGKNSKLSINGNFFTLEDPEFNLIVNGNFFIHNGTGFFNNNNAFDYIIYKSGQRIHLQMILENDFTLRIGIFIKKGNHLQKQKVIVSQK